MHLQRSARFFRINLILFSQNWPCNMAIPCHLADEVSVTCCGNAVTGKVRKGHLLCQLRVPAVSVYMGWAAGIIERLTSWLTWSFITSAVQHNTVLSDQDILIQHMGNRFKMHHDHSVFFDRKLLLIEKRKLIAGNPTSSFVPCTLLYNLVRWRRSFTIVCNSNFRQFSHMSLSWIFF